MMRDEEVVEVVVNSTLVLNPGGASERLDLALASEVNGVSACGTVLTFHRGIYDVRINLPDEFVSDAHMFWTNQGGRDSVLTPIFVTPMEPGATWVEFILTNDLSSGTEQFFFQLGGNQDAKGKFAPTIVSEPPPSLLLQSS